MRQTLGASLLFFLAATMGLGAAGPSPPQFEQTAFSFGWSPPGLVVPTTPQCSNITISWTSNPGQPDIAAPFTLQIYTSLNQGGQPLQIIDGIMGLSYNYTVTFPPGTQYQICMLDGNGRSGGCQYTYTVVANPDGDCTPIVLSVPLKVHLNSSTGESPVGTPGQCTDLTVTPLDGTPPFTYTIAPSGHPPLFLHSDSMDPITWQVSLSWANQFWISLADSQNPPQTWLAGPMRVGGAIGDDTSCLALGYDDDAGFSAGAVGGSVIGGILAGLLIAVVAFWLFNRRRTIVASVRRVRERTPFSIDPQGPVTPFVLNTPSRQSITVRSLPSLSSFQFSEKALPAAPDTGNPFSPCGSGSSTSNAVYVVHHDAGRPPPVTVLTMPGTSIFELPPRYRTSTDLPPAVISSSVISDSPFSDSHATSDMEWPAQVHSLSEKASLQTV